MKKQLHILKNPSDQNAIAVIKELAYANPSDIKVVLIQDGRKLHPQWKVKTYLLKDELILPSPLPEGMELIDYDQFVDLMFEADSVVSW